MERRVQLLLRSRMVWKRTKSLDYKNAWDTFGFVDFLGHIITSPKDVAQLFSIYRNPALEYFHIVLLKEGQIVRQMAMILVISNYPKSQGYVIEVAADGSTTMNSDAISLLEDWTPASETIQHFLGEFINELRSVSSDPQIVQTNIDKLYDRVTGLAIQEVTDYIKETNPKNRLKSETVTVKLNLSCLCLIQHTR